MMRFPKKTIPALLVAALAVSAVPILTPSCANTTTPPSGGPKDTIPPEMVACEPVYNTVNVTTNHKKCKLEFIFNEYVTVKDASKNIFLSPPQKKTPQYVIKGKSVIISFKEDLDSNRTYSLDLGAAIADNNEGNPFPRFVYSFSTGDIIDSLFVSGTVVDAISLLPQKGATVLFYEDMADSAVFNQLPSAAARTDDWGYFAVRNLKSSPYRVYAVQDGNNNNKYDPDTEPVAFLDSVIVPDHVMVLDMPELALVSIKDTTACLSRPTQIQLKLFNEVPSKQYRRDKGRPVKRMVYVTFSTPYVELDSLEVSGYDESDLIQEYNITRDSLNVWINDQGEMKDTIRLIYRYMMSDDSLNVLVPHRDTLIFPPLKPKLTKNRMGNAVEVKDTVAKYTLTVTPETVEQEGFLLEFDAPLIKAPFDSITLKCINARQQVRFEKFTVEADTITSRKFVIRPVSKMQPGDEYTLKIPHRLFVDINGLPCDSLVKKVSLPNDDELSLLTFEFSNVRETYLVELVNEARDKVFRHYKISADAVLNFPYLSKGKYSLRITQDKNGNGIFDTGSLLNKRQPEKVLLYKFGEAIGNNAFVLDIPSRMEVTQTVDMEQMFK